MMDHIAVFTGTSHPQLALDICENLGVSLGDAHVSRFSEGEISVKINENVRGKDVFIIQPTCSPPNENLMELLILIDAMRRASAKRITAVVPYFGYARQDRKDQPRVPITAKLVANLLDGAGTQRVLTMDLHAGQIQGFFDIPLDNLYAINVFMDYFLTNHNANDLVVVGPDVGSVKLARTYANRFQCGLAVVDKRRVSFDKAEVMHIMGDVNGKNVIIVDDIVATAGSLCEAAHALKSDGAKEIYAAITHGILSGPAIERIQNAPIKELVITDTIPLPEEKRIPVIQVVSVAPVLAEAIKRIYSSESISALFHESWVGT